MSRFFPHTSHAEDQRLAKTILTAHTLYRGFQTGATLGIAAASTQTLISRIRASTSSGYFLRYTGIGAIAGTALMVPALAARMWGREEIEWSDRSWRLLENEGQKEVDDWSLAGTVAGALVTARRTTASQAGRGLQMLGGSGAGSMVGVVGYMVWRYGVHGGQ